MRCRNLSSKRGEPLEFVEPAWGCAGVGSVVELAWGGDAIGYVLCGILQSGGQECCRGGRQ
jgi:hypothetical protein